MGVTAEDIEAASHRDILFVESCCDGQDTLHAAPMPIDVLIKVERDAKATESPTRQESIGGSSAAATHGA